MADDHDIWQPQEPGKAWKSAGLYHVTLLEHEAAKWLKPQDLDTVKWLPADEEIIKELKQ